VLIGLGSIVASRPGTWPTAKSARSPVPFRRRVLCDVVVTLVVWLVFGAGRSTDL